MSKLSNWREEFNLVEVIDTPMTEKDAEKKVSEKKGIKNKIVINPKLGEAVEEIGGELIGMVEADTTGQHQRLDMKQMIIDRQKLRLRRKDLAQAKKEAKQGEEPKSTRATDQSNYIANEENALEKRAKENEKARKFLKKDAKDSGYTDIALRASMSKGAGVSEAKEEEKKKGRHPRDQKELDRAQEYIKKNPKFGMDEGVMKMIQRIGKKKTDKKPEKAMDAGARARRKLQQRDHETVNFLPMKEDKALEFVKKQIAAKYGKSGYVSKDNPRKPQSDAEKAKVRAHQAKIDKENAAARAKDPSQGRYSRPY